MDGHHVTIPNKTIGNAIITNITLRPTIRTEMNERIMHESGERKSNLGVLTVGALGIVFGDIGTSPLYTLKECLHSAGGEHPHKDDLFGVLSLLFWALTLVVTIKYLVFIMRADNKGEGGIFALLALVPENLRSAVSGGASRAR